MMKVLCGYSKDKDGNPVLIGTMPISSQQGQADAKGAQGQKRFGQAGREDI